MTVMLSKPLPVPCSDKQCTRAMCSGRYQRNPWTGGGQVRVTVACARHALFEYATVNLKRVVLKKLRGKYVTKN